MITVGQACQLADKDCKAKRKPTSKGTWAWHGSRTLERFGAHTPLSEITFETMQLWVDELLLTLKPASVRHRVSFINKLFKLARRQGFILQRPTIDLDLPPVNNKKRAYLQPATIQAIKSKIKPWQGSIVDLFYHTGLRRLELYNALVDSVNLFEEESLVSGRRTRILLGTLEILDSKTGQSRTVCLNHEAALVVQEWVKIASARGSAYLIGPYDDRPRIKIAACLSDAFKRAAEKVGVRATTHTLRHSFATQSLRAGAKMENIQHQIGHQHITETSRYAHADRSIMWPAVFAISKFKPAN